MVDCQDIFNIINDFIKEYGIEYIVTDGANAMTTRTFGLIPRIYKTYSCEQKNANDLKTALSEVVKIINYIKVHSLNSRLSTLLYRNMGVNIFHYFYTLKYAGYHEEEY